MLTDKSYKQLIVRLQNDEATALNALYDNYGGALYGMILRMVGNEGKATEILQDTFVRVWSHRAKYDPAKSRLYTWMARIARNLSINYLNSKEYKQLAKIQKDDNLVSLSNGNDSSIQVDTIDIKGSVEHLDSKYQEVIDYIYFRGYTHQELSDELDMPLGTVKSRLKIALRELRKIYDYQLLLLIMVLFPIMKHTTL